MKFFATVSMAASMQLGSVKSFQVGRPLAVVSSTKTIGAVTPGPRSAPPSALFALFFTDDPQAELEDIKKKYADLTESLDQAKKRQDEAQENADLIRKERADVDSDTEEVISRLKRDLSEEISDLSDKIEGAQDDLRNTVSKTKSEISNIRGEVHEREERLYSEISDLESRLKALRKEAANAAKERDAVKNSIRRDERDAEAASRSELEKAKREAAKEKKVLTRESWALETRIQEARAAVAPATRELEDAKREDSALPRISSLKDALMEMKRKMLPQVKELKEKRAAGEMFFDQSLKKVKRDKKDELNAAKSAYEDEISAEDSRLENAASNFEMQLEAAEKELQRNAELAAKPVEPDGESAIAEAAKNRVALYQDKVESVARMQDARDDAMKKVAESHSAIQDQYDAEYENELRNLEGQDARGRRRLEEADRRRERRRGQLQREMEELTRKLSLMMQDERAAAERDYQSLKQTKTTELTNGVARSKDTADEIQRMRANLKYVEYELGTLEYTSQQRQETLAELEEERASFRKQARRTMAVAIRRITRRGSRAKGG